MLYTVEQVANQLNVSKQAIYSKLKLKEYKDRILIKQGKKYIDDTLFNLIKDNLKVKTNLNNDNNVNTQAYEEKSQDTILNDDLLNLNKELINTLLDQLKEKDKQIQEKDNQIRELHQIVQNSQILLKDKPKDDMLLLEDHFQDLDNKLLDIREQMQERKEAREKKSLFNKLFKK